MENFDSSLAEILEVDTVSMDAELASFECWDSLTILSIIAFAGDKYRVALSAAEVTGASTVGSLKALIEGKL